MTLAYASWVSETGTLTGTDPTYTLPNVATTASGNQYLRTLGAAFTAASDVMLTISNSTSAETSLWTFTPGASGAAGTIQRVQLMESSTGAAINWSGQTVTIGLEIPAPAGVSAGATSVGNLPFLALAGGEVDWSTLPDDFQTLSGGVTPGTQLGYTNALDTFNNGNGNEDVGTLNGWENYWLFRWRGPRKITTASMVVTTAGSATYSLGIMSIGASSLTLIQTVTTGGFSDAATGVQTVSGLSFDLPQGDYVLQMVYASGSGSGGQLLMQSQRELAHGPNFGWANGSAGWGVDRGFLNNAGASTLASSFSGTPGGGFGASRAFPKIWFNGTN